MKKALILILSTILAGSFVLALEIGPLNFQEKIEEKTQREIEQKKAELKEKQDIKKELPKIEFLNLKEKEALSGTKELEIKAEKVEGIEIQSVEIYLRNTSSLSPVFVGKAEKISEGGFKFSLNTANFPNGNYVIFAKAITNLGEYEVEGGLIEIANKVKEEVKKAELEKIEKMKKEMEISQPQLIEKEKIAEKVVQETKREVENKIQETTKEIPVKMEKKEIEITPEIKDLKKILENEIAKGETPQIKQEKEMKKEEIVKKIVQPFEEKIQNLPQKEKEIAMRKKEELEEKIKEELKKTEIKLAQIAKAKKEISELSFKDSDEDGLYDWQEISLGTDPLNPDTDQDGFLDGIEVKYGFDPQKLDPAKRMFVGDPKKEGRISEKLSVEKVEILEGKLKITGKGIPKSFVKIYIYSSPIIAMVRVNEKGYFEYILDKPLADGTHTVYVVLTNNQGKIEEKSPAFSFVKTGDKILRITELEAKVPTSPAQSLLNLFLIFTLATIVIALGIAFFVISLAIRGKK
jgi:hypothetical protein